MAQFYDSKFGRECFQNKPFMAIISVFIIIIGLLFIFMTGRTFIKAYKTTKWQPVDGKIIRSDISEEGAGLYAGGSVYKWNVVYTFKLNQKEYSGSTVSVGLQSSSVEDVAENVIEKYPVEKAVEVYYDANDPNQSCLEPGVKWYTYLFQLLGPMICLMGGIMLYFICFSKNRDEADYMEKYKKVNQQ